MGSSPGPQLACSAPHLNNGGEACGPGRGLLEVSACSVERESQEAKRRGLRTRIPRASVGGQAGGITICITFPTAYWTSARPPPPYLGIPQGVRSLAAAMTSGARTEASASCSTAALPRGSQVLRSNMLDRTCGLPCCRGAAMAQGRGRHVPQGAHQGQILAEPDLPQPKVKRLLPPGLIVREQGPKGRTRAPRPLS